MFGLQWSELLFENQYTFVANDWAAVRNIFANWNPSDAGLRDVPKPQLVYVYNGSKCSQQSKVSEEVSLLRSQLSQLTKLRADIAGFMASFKHEIMLELESQDSRLIEMFNASRAADRAENQQLLSVLVDKFIVLNIQCDEKFAMLTLTIIGALISQSRLTDLHHQLHQMENQILQSHTQDEHIIKKKTRIENLIEFENQRFLQLTTQQMTIANPLTAPTTVPDLHYPHRANLRRPHRRNKETNCKPRTAAKTNEDTLDDDY